MLWGMKGFKFTTAGLGRPHRYSRGWPEADLGGDSHTSLQGGAGLSTLPMGWWSCLPTAVMIRRGLAANLRIYIPARLENEFQLLAQLAEGQLLIWNVNGRYALRNQRRTICHRSFWGG